jgi:UDP-glucose 4-epimerase
MNILILGGTGEIGKPLVKKMRENNNLTVVSRKPPDTSYKSVNYIQFDIRNKEEVDYNKNDLIDTDILINLADEIIYSTNVLNDLNRALSVSSEATINILNCMENLKQVVYSSSYSVYGNPEFRSVDETAPIKPRNTYAIGKITTEYALGLYSTMVKIPVAILRISSVYGPNTPKNRLIPVLTHNIKKNIPINIYGDGMDSRDYIHVEDVVDSIMMSIDMNYDGILNIGSGKETSIINLLEFALSLNSNYKGEITYKERKTDKLNICLDIGKANEKIYFKPKHDLKSDMKELMKVSRN